MIPFVILLKIVIEFFVGLFIFGVVLNLYKFVWRLATNLAGKRPWKNKQAMDAAVNNINAAYVNNDAAFDEYEKVINKNQELSKLAELNIGEYMDKFNEKVDEFRREKPENLSSIDRLVSDYIAYQDKLKTFYICKTSIEEEKIKVAHDDPTYGAEIEELKNTYPPYADTLKKIEDFEERKQKALYIWTVSAAKTDIVNGIVSKMADGEIRRKAIEDQIEALIFQQLGVSTSGSVSAMETQFQSV